MPLSILFFLFFTEIRFSFQAEVGCGGSQPSHSDTMKRMACGSKVGDRRIVKTQVQWKAWMNTVRDEEAERAKLVLNKLRTTYQHQVIEYE